MNLFKINLGRTSEFVGLIPLNDPNLLHLVGMICYVVGLLLPYMSNGFISNKSNSGFENGGFKHLTVCPKFAFAKT